MLSTARLQILLPLCLLLLGGVAVWALMSNPPKAIASPVSAARPTVSIWIAQPQSLSVTVHSQGVVSARQSLDVSPEVAGKVVFLHKNWVVGGVFGNNEILLSLDTRDYDHAIIQAQAKVAEAEQVWAIAKAQAEQARSEWQTVNKAAAPSPLLLQIPQLATARAKLAAAKADLALAETRRSRCVLRAPFAGRIHSQQVAVGQFVQPGDKLARLNATEVAQIRLPIAAKDLGLLDLPLLSPNSNTVLPKVTLSAEIGGQKLAWGGYIVRTEGAIDESTGILMAVAEVQEPYQLEEQDWPLWFGLFVQADIVGKTLAQVFVLPPAAINASQQVWVVDAQQKLHSRQLEVLRNEPQRILVSAGLSAGDRVVVSDLPIAVEGMTVTPVTQAAQP